MHECVPVCMCVGVVQGILGVCLKYYKSCYKYRQLWYFLHLSLPSRINMNVRKSLHYTQISHVTCYLRIGEGGRLWGVFSVASFNYNISLCLFECSFYIQNIFLHLFMHFLVWLSVLRVLLRVFLVACSSFACVLIFQLRFFVVSHNL